MYVFKYINLFLLMLYPIVSDMWYLDYCCFLVGDFNLKFFLCKKIILEKNFNLHVVG